MFWNLDVVNEVWVQFLFNFLSLKLRILPLLTRHVVGHFVVMVQMFENSRSTAVNLKAQG